MLIAEQVILDQLLRQGRPATVPRNRRSENTKDIKAAVLIKIFILTGDQRLFHTLRDVFELHQVPPLGITNAINHLILGVSQHDTGIIAVHQPLLITDVARIIKIASNWHDDQKQ